MKSLARKAKRTRPHQRTEAERQALSESGHVALGKEAKLLRRIMAETGLTEEEVRERECYRKQLAEAYKEGCEKKASTSREARWFKRNVIKPILKELKHPKEHPKVRERIEERVKRIRETGHPFIIDWWLRHGRYRV